MIAQFILKKWLDKKINNLKFNTKINKVLPINESFKNFRLLVQVFFSNRFY
jgi:hypothetical protein